MKDIMIACIEGLKGFPDAIKSVFPDTAVQLCVIHQIRNSMKYVGSKYQKEFMRDLKPVYGAVTMEAGIRSIEDSLWISPIVICVPPGIGTHMALRRRPFLRRRMRPSR